MFSLPSIDQIRIKASATFRRFPFALTLAILGTIGVIWIADKLWNQEEVSYLIKNFCWVSALSISAFTAVTVMGEGRKWKRITINGSRFLLLILLTIYYLALPENFEPSATVEFYRYLLLFLASHLLVSFVPYAGLDRVNDFWAYNKILFLRILLSALYVGILFNGLSVAIYSTEVLLEFDISGIRYGQLAIFLTGIFGTWFFLSGVPHPDQLTVEEKVYPKGLRIFSQYVLIPLVVVYIAILYMYMGKIILEWEWPNGWVSNLVLSYSIVGILSLLLLHPIKEEEGHKWIRIFSRGFFIVMIPLVVLLMLSIWVRISEYGVTVNRYIVATLAVWLAGIVIYFLLSRNKNIKVIPASLCLVTVLIVYGPFSAFEVSERSQLNRLEDKLQEYELLSESGTVLKAEKDIPFKDRKQISSGINYLIELKGIRSIQPYFDQDLQEVLANKDSMNVVSDAAAITNLIGIEYVNDWEMEFGADEEYAMFQYQKKRMDPVPLQGYDHFIGDLDIWSDSRELLTTIGDYEYTIYLDNEDYDIRITRKDSGEALVFDLKAFIGELKDTGADKVETVSVENMTMTQRSGSLEVKLVFNSIGGQRKNGEITSVNANFDLFFSSGD